MATSIAVPLDRLQLSPGSVVTIEGISWSRYEQLLILVGDHRSYRLTYYRGTLEIVMPSEVHEILIRLMDWMISTLCEEWELNLKTSGSTVLKSRSLKVSPEPDNGYYSLSHLDEVQRSGFEARGKRQEAKGNVLHLFEKRCIFKTNPALEIKRSIFPEIRLPILSWKLLSPIPIVINSRFTKP